mgnify:FL=1
MKGEQVDIAVVDPALVKSLAERADKNLSRHCCLTFYGESASGKTVTSSALVKELRGRGLSVVFVQMDDYFKLPPQQNQAQRARDINHVGPDEVNIDVIDKHIKRIKNGAKELSMPQVDFVQSVVRPVSRTFDTPVDFIVAEGTYLYLLENDDLKFFITRSYHQTLQDRKRRDREPMTDLNMKTLEIEHRIVQSQRDKADYIIDENFRLRRQETNA